MSAQHAVIKGILGFGVSGGTAVVAWLETLNAVVRLGASCVSLLVGVLTFMTLWRALRGKK